MGDHRATEATPVHDVAMERRYLEKVLVEKDAGGAHVTFHVDVLNRYRDAGYTMYRTRNAGRVQAPEGWRLDFGIVDDAGVIHAALRDVLKLPRAERRHFAAYGLSAGMNARYLKMQMGLGACVDEGDIAAWDGRPQAAQGRAVR